MPDNKTEQPKSNPNSHHEDSQKPNNTKTQHRVNGSLTISPPTERKPKPPER